MIHMWNQDQFVSELKIVVSKKQKLKLKVEEGWYNEEELRTEFKWSQPITQLE